MDQETACRVALLQIAHAYASDESDVISIAESFWEWANGGEVVITFEPEGEK
ncbi:hypothetical protein Pan3_64 [Pseudanabaena phage Pan3]|nr:hypothetical protein Pan3_64 [Pseudanabaena phage Pan3]